MQPQSIASETRSLLPLCPSCGAPMRIRTIGVIDRREDVRFACTACDTETVKSYKLGD
jgi:transposase-like protein